MTLFATVQIELHGRFWPAKGSGRRVHGSDAAQNGTATDLIQVGSQVINITTTVPNMKAKLQEVACSDATVPASLPAPCREQQMLMRMG